MAGPEFKDLYTQNPGTAAVASPPQVGPVATPPVERAASSGYSATQRQIGGDELADAQLARITSQDSPLMKRARQEGMLSAARRGLQNSSIAAGASQAAMVDRAAPLAMQNSQHLLTQGLANQESDNRAKEVSTGRDTDISVANATMSNQMTGQTAQMSNDNARLNAGFQQDANLANANATNTMRLNVLNQNAEINRQYLAGTQALDLATVQGRHQMIISQNEQAGNLFDSAMDNVAQILSNKDLDPTRAAQAVRLINENLDAGLRLIDALNGGSGAAPAAAGTRSQLPTTPPPVQMRTINIPGLGSFQIPMSLGQVQ